MLSIDGLVRAKRYGECYECAEPIEPGEWVEIDPDEPQEMVCLLCVEEGA